MKLQTSLLIASLVASMASAATEAYRVSTSIYSQGQLVAAPEMVVEANQMASFSVGNDFSYHLKVTPNQGATAAVETSVTVGDIRLNPSFTVTYGKEATIEVGAQKLTILVNRVGN